MLWGLAAEGRAGELPVPDANAFVAAGNVKAPVVTGNSMVVQQQSDKAVLNWQSFNIGAENSVHFDQPSATSVALNNIHQADPSRIFGTLTADGQIYLVNQSGFVFGKDSQVNTNALVATTLNISQEALQNGIVQTFDLTKNAALSANGPQAQGVQIIIEKGAEIRTSGSGGRIILAAPKITNEGSIESPDGQVILAGSKDKVYLQPAPADSGVRGLLVEVGTGGEVKNLGKIVAERGNASLIGFLVTQQGKVSTTTSVNLNGSVRLLAREGIQNPSSTAGALRPGSTKRTTDLGDGLGLKSRVVLGSNPDGSESLTSVELDADKTTTAVDAQAQPKSRIEIMGHTVVAGSGSVVRAKSGNVSITAVDDPKLPKVKGTARIFLDKNSRIDVSGVKNVSLAMERNVIEAELRNNELRDAPLQKDGVLHGTKVSVDIRDIDSEGHIPIADLSGALARIARNIDERSTAAGTISLTSSGDVITKAGSLLDVSGGSVMFRDGFIQTTQLVAGNQTFDIASADPNRRYTGILGGSLGKLPGLGLGHFERGYVQGKDAGKVSIAAFNAWLDGVIQGKAVSGLHQRLPEQQAAGSSLAIDLTGGGAAGTQGVQFVKHASGDLGAEDAFPSDQGKPVALQIDPGFFKKSGIRDVSIQTNADLTVDRGSRVDVNAGGSLHLSASGFDVQGRIVAPSGDVSLGASPYVAGTHVTLGGTAMIDVAGRWINDRTGTGLPDLFIDGGSVKIAAEQGDLKLEAGSRIDASGGGWLAADGRVKGGAGGAIDLSATTVKAGGAPSSLILDGKLTAGALQHGGSLRLRSNQVVIGNASAAVDHAATGEQALVLAPSFFQSGGFADFDIGSTKYGVTIADGTQINLQQRNFLLPQGYGALGTGTRLAEVASLGHLPDPLRGPSSLKLSLNQELDQNFGQILSVGRGASIRTEAGGSIELASDTSIRIDGTLSTPAGHIGLSLTTPKVEKGFNASQSIWLGQDSRLLARGTFERSPNAQGLVQGEVLDGGRIDVKASRGYLVTETGSLIDVSGTRQTLDFAEASRTGIGYQVGSRTVHSSGGEVALRGGEGIIADGSIKAASGGGTAAGGSLTVELNGGLRDKPSEALGNPFPDDRQPGQARSIVVSAADTSFLPGNLAFGADVPTADFSGKVLLAAPKLNEAGLSSLTLRTDAVSAESKHVGSIVFKGDVALKAGREIRLDSPMLAWTASGSSDTGQVTLDSPYVALGSSRSRIDIPAGNNTFNTTVAPDATGGTARFDVAAHGIDLIGGLSFGGFGQVNLTSEGDIRAIGIAGAPSAKNFLGELKFGGNLLLRGDQVYPTTLSDYRITGSGAGKHTLEIQGNGGKLAPVYSAGGKLTLTATDIEQNGVVKAPMGSLALNATEKLSLGSGSLTSVSADGLTIPFGRGSAGQNWLYPLNPNGSVNLVVDQPPEKRLSLSAQDLALNAGATVDLSGGGELYAYEFISGTGGSRDVLDATDPSFVTQYAVLPSVQGISTPYDPLEFPSSGLKVGDSVYLGEAEGLKAGWYTLLPAHYALLPGAYLITPQAGTRDLASGSSYTRLDGVAVVAGRYGVAGTNIADSRWQGFAVEHGAMARTRSEYKDYGANEFFTGKAERDGTAVPSLPQDAGSLVLSATASIALDAVLKATPAGSGRSGQVDIDGDRLAVVASRDEVANSPSGTVSLVADDLNRLNAPSLLVGGQRRRDKDGLHVTVGASKVNVAGGANLQGQEIVLAARDELRVSSGATVASTGKTGVAGETLHVANASETSGDGALLRVSASGQANVIRGQGISGATGDLVVESGAQLKAEGSMLLESTRNTRFEGDINMQGGSLALNASTISLGSAPANIQGLVLNDTRFNLDELRLNSYSTVDLYGSLNVAAKSLVIDSAGVNGYGNAGTQATVTADRITLANSRSASGGPGTGSGSLELNAQEINLGAGSYRIGGYRSVALNAGNGGIKGLSGDRPGQLTVAADTRLSTGRVYGENGATTAIDAAGHTLTLEGGTRSGARGGLGARWNLTADSITASGGTLFDLQSGQLGLTALTGDLTLGEGTVIDVSGRTQAFGSLTRFGSAGAVSLTASEGAVALRSGAEIDLSGANAGKPGGGNAGSLSVAAAHGGFGWEGVISAKGGEGSSQGRIELDVGSVGDFSALNDQVKSSGFSESVSLRQRSGDLVVAAADTVLARRIVLELDQGRADIHGKLDASGDQGGSVSVSARNGIGLTGSIEAKGRVKTGGTVLLDTVHKDDGGSGRLDLASADGRIDVSGGEGGAIHLRTGRDATGNINVTAINTRLQGQNANRSALEGTRVYEGVSTIDSAAITGWKADTAAFMQTVSGVQGNGPLRILPGLEIRNTGDLTLASRWDLMDGQWDAGANGGSGAWQSTWRYGDGAGGNTLPGYLTLRAGGDLNLSASLNDAFATSPLPGADPTFRFQDVLQPGLSWSYNLVAGGDINLAPSFQAPNPKDPVGASIATQVVVRTGTGDIGLKAGGDIRFVKDAGNAKSAAAVYTAGAPARYTMADLKAGRVPGLPTRNANEPLADYLGRIDPAVASQLLRYGYLDVTQVGSFLAEYPTRGGSVSLTAGGNIAGIQTGQLISDWLVRSGSWSDVANDPARQATAWGIDVSGNFRTANLGTDAAGNTVFDKGNRFFNQNVGALGGGDVSIRAGGDISDLSAMLPTTGKPLGVVDDRGRWQANGTQVGGGGDLTVTAGGDIQGGEYFVGLGKGQITAGGSLGQGAGRQGTVLELGDGKFDVEARKDARLGTVFNPTVVRQTDIPRTTRDTYFFTYGADSAVSLGSAGGDIILENDVRSFKASKGLGNNTGTGFEFAVYPGTLQATAWSGDIRLNGATTLFPSRTGRLELLADGSVTTDVSRAFAVNLSDTDPSQLPGAANPASELEGSVLDKRYRARERLDPFVADASLIHAAQPLHAGSQSKSYVVANTGDIAFSALTPTSWFMPMASEFRAGRDIRNLTLFGQNLGEDDVTLVGAGRDVVYDAPLDGNGNVISLRDSKLELGGPGHLQVLAGRDINLGSASGVVTIGRARNSALPGPSGASIEVLAGLSGTVDYDGFAAKYGDSAEYGAVIASVAGKPREEQLPVLLQVLFDEVKASAGAAAAASPERRAALYKRGFDAIYALFPKGQFDGDLAMVFSQIKTLAGGGIDLVVPGGKVDVGLAGKNGGISKGADQLGIVVQGTGDLNALTQGDFNVNQSRVFTLGGGSIAVWSSEGNIDAGKGAQAAISAPPPITSVDASGNIVTIFPPIVSGSGIQAIVPATLKDTGGFVYLAAPAGYIDAGEAGIACERCFVSGNQVLNGQFIVSTSGTVGVPATVAPPVMPASADSAASGAAKSAVQTADAGSKGRDDDCDGKDDKDCSKRKNATVSILSADVVGYGQCSVAEVREGKAGCGG
jgi:filamentous hemagglutinin family protein